MENKIKEIKIPNELEDGPSELLRLISENTEGVNHTFVALIEKSKDFENMREEPECG